MAKKVSKHSRAARRNEIDEPEAKSLASLPRAEKTDLTSAMIRATTKKNEDLLHNKMQKKDPKFQIEKKNAAKANQATNLNKLRMERAIMQSDILQDKILKSKQRSKLVQTTRKQNWDAINQAAAELKARQDQDQEQKQDQQKEQDEDAMEEEEKFYSEDEDQEDSDSSSSSLKPQRNAFDLLNDEVEA